MSRILVRISSVERLMISSGMSSQVSSAGLSGVVSIATSGAADADEEDAAASAGLFAVLSGGFGGCVEDMVGGE